MSSLLTPEEYEAFTGTTSSTTQIAVMCEAVSKVVENFIGKELEYRERVEYYSSNGTDSIALRVRPVWEVTEVRMDSNGYYGANPDSFDDDSILDPESDYTLDITEVGQPSKSGLLYRIRGKWELAFGDNNFFGLTRDYLPLQGNIKVTYTAGYDPIPSDIKMVCVQIIQRLKNHYLKYGGPLEREHLGDWSYKMADFILGAFPELGSARQTLSKYRELPW